MRICRWCEKENGFMIVRVHGGIPFYYHPKCADAWDANEKTLDDFFKTVEPTK